MHLLFDQDPCLIYNIIRFVNIFFIRTLKLRPYAYVVIETFQCVFFELMLVYLYPDLKYHKTLTDDIAFLSQDFVSICRIYIIFVVVLI